MKEAVTLAGKQKDSNEIEPVKAQPRTDNEGGILTAKVAAIVQQIKRKFKKK